ncbi:hypothetical protein GCM10023081_01670 [Arthrobacter ginkgonis]|uniref:Uncharacterized protein n=1 Tax=Arthrobacter ginkgonis TaxID=1630594 RepID=A0ABP7BRA3_9MICC
MKTYDDLVKASKNVPMDGVGATEAAEDKVSTAAIAFFVELGLELEGEPAAEGGWVPARRAGWRRSGHRRRADPGRPRPGRAVDVPHAGGPQHCAGGADQRPGHPSPHVHRGRRRRTSSTACAPMAPKLVGEVTQYGDIYRYCYVRGPDGIITGLVEELR